MAGRISFDRVAGIYDATRALPPAVHERVVSELTRRLRGRRVLDVGVGTGRFAGPLQRGGVRVVGTDIAPKMQALAAQRGVRHLVLGDAARIPLRDGSVDYAMTVHL